MICFRDVERAFGNPPMSRLSRRIEKLEAWLTDVSYFAPKTPKWSDAVLADGGFAAATGEPRRPWVYGQRRVEATDNA